MQISAGILEKIVEDEQAFCDTFIEYTRQTFAHAQLFPKLSMPRLVETRGAWHNDLHRVEEHEPNLENGLDHFKRCGDLAFWIRRMSPLIDAYDIQNNLADGAQPDLLPREARFRELLFGYANEYLAFDFGYQFCSYYEQAKEGGSNRAKNLQLSEDYIRSMCHFLKYKTVSPHALFLIYKSLFLG